MKPLFYFLFVFVFISCNNYLDDVPKGTKIPTTLADFEAFIRNENTNHRVNITQALNLLNDRNNELITLASDPLTKANYMWDHNANRIALNNSIENTYYDAYLSISSFNLIIENVLRATESTEEQRKTVWAQAKILRAMSYYNLLNFYADTYVISSAYTKLSVPLITSAEVNAPSRQITIGEMYDFIFKELDEALPYLPKFSQTPLHPNLGTAYAFYSRIYLQGNNYKQALQYADMALGENNKLYDWTVFYYLHKDNIENPDSYLTNISPMGYDYIENYNFRHGANTEINSESDIPMIRAQKFEKGDARFLSRWKKTTLGGEAFYTSILSGMFNLGGITTVEIYFIKAECLIRADQIDLGINILNQIRKTRILPSLYIDISATDKTAAIKAVIKAKNNELILTLVPFADARRLNAEGLYNSTFSKMVNGLTYNLPADSHLWTMPFPLGAIRNPGNGTLIQNVEK